MELATAAATTVPVIDRELHPLLGGGVSVVFWICLGVCAALFATAALAPQIVEFETLQQQLRDQQSQQDALQGEIRHLQLLQQSLTVDPEFAARMAAAEMNLSGSAMQVPLEASLSFNPHVPRSASPREAVSVDAPWYLPLLSELAQPTPLRTRWLWCTAMLCLIAFSCIHDGIFTGPFGRTLTHLQQFFHNRYTTSASLGQRDHDDGPRPSM